MVSCGWQVFIGRSFGIETTVEEMQVLQRFDAAVFAGRVIPRYAACRSITRRQFSQRGAQTHALQKSAVTENLKPVMMNKESRVADQRLSPILHNKCRCCEGIRMHAVASRDACLEVL